ncbi:hypothetical protein PV11_03462 [Exophiala sideris]|uniref:Sodium/calcium exchanger membrane region domain-containing protein n=1 Tax=Exophiala sideris TaxID=1016849 RepID=A0A0D1VY20_9EURO|nr:hypothetical protein PV11_03462 [Exophiala sideris]
MRLSFPDRVGAPRISVLVLVLIVIVQLAVAHSPPSEQLPSEIQLRPHCRAINHVEDQCRFYGAFCGEEDEGLFSYLKLYYCNLSGAKPFALVLVLAWMVVLFASLGLVAGDFFSVNLSALAKQLNLSDTLAGVTLLALGNGAPDIFSTMASMSRSSHALALGELIGAAAFITSVVAGAMAFIRPFKVVKVSLARDVIFLFATSSFLIYVMTDGHLRLWHCMAMLIFYLFYVSVVLGWHWWRVRHPQVDLDDVAHDGHTPSQEQNETRPLLAARDRASSVAQHSQHDVTRISGEHRRLPIFEQVWDERRWYEPPAEVIDYRFVNQSLVRTLHGHRSESNPPKHSSRRGHVELPPNSNEHHDCAREQIISTQSGNEGDDEVLRNAPVNYHGYFYRCLHGLLPEVLDKKDKGRLHVFIIIMIVPISLLLKLTIPVAGVDQEAENTDGENGRVEQKAWQRWLLIIQIFLSPQFVIATVALLLSLQPRDILIPSMSVLGCSLLLCGLVILTGTSAKKSSWTRLLNIPGFIVSICWICIIANELVGVLKALGVFGDISEAILGLTLFAVGNSMDDLAANISVARHEHPVMALSACFGGPLLNTLLGVSLSGMLVFAKQSIKTHQITPIDLHITRDLFITSGTLLVNLIVLTLMLVWTRGKMTRLLGFFLMIVWLAGTVINVVLVVMSPDSK